MKSTKEKMLRTLILGFFILTSKMASGATWTLPAQTISTPGVNSSSPQIGIDTQGNIVAAWLESDALVANTYSGGSWGTSVTLATANASSPQLVVDPFGNATAMWIQSGSVLSATLPFEGSWSAPVTLTSNTSSSPALVVDATGNTVAVWVSSQIIYSATKLINGSWSATPDSLSQSGAANPKIAIGNNGTVIAVWQQLVSSVECIYAVTKNLTGSWGTHQVISDGVTNSVYPEIIVDGDGNGITAWYTYSQSGNVFSDVNVNTCFLPVGGSWSSISTISMNSGMRDPSTLVLQLGFDYHWNAIAAWTTSLDGSCLLLQAAIKPSGQPWLNPLNVNYDFYSYSFALPTTINNNAYLAYMTSSYLPNTIAIRVSSTDPDAFKSNYWTIPVTLSGSDSSGYPQIAARSDGSTICNIAVIWVSSDGMTNSIQAATGQDPITQPPQNLSVTQGSNNLGVTTEYYNTLSWTASPSSNISGYLIYRNGVLVNSIPPLLEYIDQNRVQGQAVTYGIATYTDQYYQSSIATVNYP